MVFLAQDELFNLLPENEGFCELKKKPFSPLAGTGFDVVSGTLPIMPSVTALEQYGLCSGTPVRPKITCQDLVFIYLFL